jgi:hypothetical protein
MMKKKKYRIRFQYNVYYIEEYIPEKCFWFFITQVAEWKCFGKEPTEQEAMVIVRRLQKYDSVTTVWQSDVDELDLEKALE